MDKKLLVLVHLLVKDALSELQLPEGPQGRQGVRGYDGNDFQFEDHKDLILSYVKENYKLELSEEMISSLKGRDGKSVSIIDVLPSLEESLHERIEEIRPSLKLQFSDLSEEDKEFLKGKDGSPGMAGKDGENFSFEDNKEEISTIVTSYVDSIKDLLKLKIADLSQEDLASLRGCPGPKGRDGRDFSFEENKESITDIINLSVEARRDSLKLKFSDLSPSEVLSLKGENGTNGKNGIDFLFEEHEEVITNKLVSHIESIKDSLKLKKEDLDNSDWEALRGPKGIPGKDGHSFDFDNEKENVKNILSENRKEFILSLSDLTQEEFDSLKLKLDDLSEEEKESLKGKPGARGQKGRRGLKGDPGEIGNNGHDGSTWHSGEGIPETTAKEGDFYLDVSYSDIYLRANDEWKHLLNIRGMMGPFGEKGERGIPGVSGLDGLDGRDAPIVTDIEIVEDTWNKRNYYFIFHFSDGSNLKTNNFEIPATTANNYYTTGGSHSSGGGSGSGKVEIFDEEESLGQTEKIKFIGNGVTLTKDGDTIVVDIPGIDQNTTELIVEKDGVEVVTTNEINFIGNAVTVTEDNGKAVVEINVDSALSDLNILDEGVQVGTSIKNLNFIGDNVVARLRTPISKWLHLEDVEPDIASYAGDGVSDTVDVYIEIPDSSLLQNIDCDLSVAVGNFVIVDEIGIARNAIANSYSTSNVIGLVELKPSGEKCHVRVAGLSSEIFDDLDPALDYYLSDTTPGKLSVTVPSASGHVKLKLGQAFGSKRFLIQKGERVVRL